ncbi:MULTISPECIES: helix-turn-helix domain-containing protein [unclassified Paenibacillus]|uniref:helix-turn-helix domain-containing protein n=1 Tax=unclassified Paenibacillus TaxID=185978 RepID=UPI002405B68A|nr:MULTISPECIES: helix-turn-helix domain-containing protein [unclassified Paenibacillus]MDF9840674.1 hypothetical protein [Paenibacillus sp. PastF-2]MDF9847257.1 hypothetical protein [Paenibacillus sp. PastM-2]MDF9853828.1 hypothetical protein [Paenibacillus sp. PastF-1]MDH6478686.1 hypothetical protein [Paenibacillus sp. PastH-2]MDH6506418.1 hypothetical protein [Paenibacillus sp. PastM-3]
MEKENAGLSISEEDFIKLLASARGNDKKAIERLLTLFEQDILYLSKYMRMPYEDAKQTLITELISLFKKET